MHYWSTIVKHFFPLQFLSRAKTTRKLRLRVKLAAGLAVNSQEFSYSFFNAVAGNPLGVRPVAIACLTEIRQRLNRHLIPAER
jgi:hypothetical protein